MDTRQLIPAEAAAYPGLRDLDEPAFPPEERIPWDDLLRLVDAMPLEFEVAEDAGRLLGMTIVYPRPLHPWFWYFAVPAPLRGAGIGQRILSRLVARHASRHPVLDMEDPDQPDAPNPEQRRRRLAFYLRNGFRPTGLHRVFGPVAMTLLVHGDAVLRDADWDALLAELFRIWRPQRR